MNKQRLSAVVRAGAVVRIGGWAAVSAAALLGLSACGRQTYPTPSHSAPPPAAPTADLMGAPDHASPYTAQPVYSSPAYAPPAYYSSTPYPKGAVVAMAPIPNPGDPGSAPYYGHSAYRTHRVRVEPMHRPVAAAATSYGEGHPAPGRRLTPAPQTAKAQTAKAQTPKTQAVQTQAVQTQAVQTQGAQTQGAQTAKTKAAATHSASTPTSSAAPSTTAAFTAAKAAPPAPVGKTVAANPALPKSDDHKVAAAGAAVGAMAANAQHALAKTTASTTTTTTTTTSAPKPAAAAPATAAPAPGADRSTRLASLQTALTDAVGKTAVLAAPPFTANKPTDVSLTVPAGFADTVRGEAQKDGLSDAAASVNLTALLSGDGYMVTPSDTQASPLIAGQPTTFRWTVTAQPGAKGPLHADVGADLLGGGSEMLALGSVQNTAAEGASRTSQVVGAALLVLIAAFVLAWLARSRGPIRSLEARRASRRAARGGRPLDMGTAPYDETPAP